MKPTSLAVCMIVCGDEYHQIADITAPRASKVLGAPIIRITPPADVAPHLFKLELFKHFDTEHILLLDSDIVLFDWNWNDFALDAFNAAPSQNLHHFPHILKAIRQYIPEPAPLFNTGLWLAPRSESTMFELAAKYLKPPFGSLVNFPFNFHDETPTNLALYRTAALTHTLSATYNRLNHMWQEPYLPPPGDAFGVHLLSGTPSQKLARIQAYCDAYPVKASYQSRS